MTIWDFSVDGASVIKVLRDANPPREQSFEALSLRMVDGIIYLYESGIYASAIKFEQIGDIEGVPPTDLQDAYDKIIAIIPSGGSGATPTLQEVTTEGAITNVNTIWESPTDPTNIYIEINTTDNSILFWDKNIDAVNAIGVYIAQGNLITTTVGSVSFGENTGGIFQQYVMSNGQNMLFGFRELPIYDVAKQPTYVLNPDKLTAEYVLATLDDITGGATDLAYTPSPTNGIVTSSTGTDATLPLADGTNAGLLKPADFTQLSTLATDLANINTDAVDKVTVKLALGISKGQAVYISSANGTNIIVSKASNASEATSSKTLGLLVTTGVTNDFVEVVTSGLLDGLDTSTASAGDPVWLGVSGNLIFGLVNKPVAPAHLVYIGVVTRASATVGEIFVRPQNGFELSEIHDVLITSVADRQMLSYDSASSLWKNKTIATADDILFQDITINMPTNGSITVNNVVGTALTISGTPAIRTITDTSLFTRTTRVGLETTIVPANVFTFRQVVGYFSINTGFKASFKFGASTGATNSNVRYSIGIFPANFSVTNVDPTTFINCAAFARIDGSNNWNFIHNDATGTATAIDLGASFPANTVSTDIYYAVIETISGNIKYTLTRLNTGDTITSTVSTNLVAASTLLGMSAGCSNNANAAICALDFGGMQLTKFT